MTYKMLRSRTLFLSMAFHQAETQPKNNRYGFLRAKLESQLEYLKKTVAEQMDLKVIESGNQEITYLKNILDELKPDIMVVAHAN